MMQRTATILSRTAVRQQHRVWRDCRHFATITTPVSEASNSDDANFRPRRCLLSVPGSDPRKIAKAQGIGADTVVLDLEDGVALDQKDEARQLVHETLLSDDDDFGSSELAVRINHAKPKAILSASCGIEGARVIAYKPLLDEAINLSDHKPDFP